MEGKVWELFDIWHHDQWCLRMLLGIKWYQFVRNDDVRRLTKQPKLTAIIQLRRLTLFGHIMRMVADAKRILLASPPADWRRQLGRPCITWLSTVQQDLETTPPYAPQSSRFGSESPSVEDDVDVWRYAIVRVACQKRRRRLDASRNAEQQCKWCPVCIVSGKRLLSFCQQGDRTVVRMPVTSTATGSG